jgi:hypothetical protein
MYKHTDTTFIIRVADNAFIPQDLDNTDYQNYLQWVAAGGTTLPADIPVKVFTPLTKWQVLKVLRQFGLLASVEAAIAEADDITKEAWQYASTYERTSTVLNGMAQVLGMSSEQLDTLFEVGATL